MSGDVLKPIQFVWFGERALMVPQQRFLTLASRQYVDQEEYALGPVDEISEASRRHYFAALKEGWMNLPAHVAVRFPSSEHLRRWCLVQCGFRTESYTVFDTEKDAKTFAKGIRDQNEYAVIKRSGTSVWVGIPKSQSSRAMRKKEFQESKDRVLDLVAQMIGTERRHLEDRATELVGRPRLVVDNG